MLHREKGEYMTEVQRIILDIFKSVDLICRNNHINYYAIGGTCLGALRHQGFIPWDDDLDIGVPIEQFDYLIELLQKELPEYYSVRFIDHNDQYGNMFVKVIDERTTCIEKLEYKYPKAFKGVFVDIMPLSGMPDNKLARYIFCKKINIYRVLNDIRRFDIDAMDMDWKKKIYPLVRFFDRLIPIGFFAHRWYRMLKRYPFNKCKYTGYVWWFDVLRLVYRKEVFGTPTSYPFESVEMLCPQDADAMMRQQFGNYMELPPVEKRVPCHVGTLDLNHSYHEYQKGELALNMEE